MHTRRVSRTTIDWHSNLAYGGIGLLAFGILVLLFGIPTALLPNPWFRRMIPARAADYVFLLLNSALLAGYIALHLYEKHELRKGADALAASGGLLNILAVGCPVCNALLVALFGTSAIMAYIEPARVWIGVATSLLVGVAVYLKIKKVKSCKLCLR